MGTELPEGLECAGRFELSFSLRGLDRERFLDWDEEWR